MDIIQNLQNIRNSLPDDVTLVAVSKTKPVVMVEALFNGGQIDFGENKVQELQEKQPQLPSQIRWHMIGHLQSNKVKYIAPFIHLIHSVDSLKLLRVINKEGEKNNRIINCLLQIHIASEETKFGLSEQELMDIILAGEWKEMQFVNIRGLMGMATFTEDSEVVGREFRNLKRIFEDVRSDHLKDKSDFTILSMGMSEDYQTAIEEGSTMIRVGSLIFGPRGQQ
ncbi:MAG: YggS family pyridoxal phosphate-dependent enzyme [Bacteroidales bacterium]|nr:YggS family pyridoxal phosphate-dependent enzyme [Bacteroidales bacterium]